MAKAKKDATTDLGELNMSAAVGEQQEYFKSPSDLSETVVPNIKFYQARGKEIPQYATLQSAGFDFRVDIAPGDKVISYNHRNVKEEKSVRDDNGVGRVYLEPGDRALIPTGLFADIPADKWIAIHARSGTSWKEGLILTNGVGVVDADYVDEIKISLTNNTGTRVAIRDGDRIAQGVLMQCYNHGGFEVLEGKPKQKTDREGGFGSTGVK